MLDYVNDPAFKDLEYGDVVGAIQFDPNSNQEIKHSKDSEVIF